MASVAVTWEPKSQAERDLVAKHLADNAVWLVDDPGAALACKTAFMFWPRTELRAADLSWSEWPALEQVHLATAGANHIGWRDLPANIEVSVTPGASGPAMAEWITGAVVSWTRGQWLHSRRIREGRFELGAPTRSLHELTIGFVGYGGIAQHAVDALWALAAAIPRPPGAEPGTEGAFADQPAQGPRFMAVTRTGQSDDPRLAWTGTMEQLADMAGACDVLIVALPLTTATKGVVDAAVLARMSLRETLLVNVARGPVVDETSLFAWLDADINRHFAALDVWWRYPRLPEEDYPFHEPFQRLPNVLMTPHASPNTAGFRLRMIDAGAQALAAAGRSGQRANVVDRDAYEGIAFDADPRG